MKKGMLAALCVAVAMAWATGVRAQDKKVVLSSLDWEPYIGEKLKGNGYVAELVKEAFKRSGYDMKIDFVPWARAVMLAENGKTDGLFPEYLSDERKAKFVFSDPFPGGPVGLYKRKDLDVKFSGDPKTQQTDVLKALAKHKFGVVRGYVNTPEFDAATFIQKEDVTDDEANLKKLLAKRIDFIFIDKYVAAYLVDSKLPEAKGQLEFMEPSFEDKPLYIAFSKAASDYEAKLKAFNEGLKKIKDDGTLAKIMKDNGF